MKTKIILVLIISFLLVIGGYFLKSNFSKNKIVKSSDNNTKLSTTTANSNKTKIEGDGQKKTSIAEQITIGYNKQGKLIIKPVETKKEDLPNPPNLDKAIVFGIDLPSEQKIKMTKKIQNLISELKKDSTNFDNWLELGLDKKFVGDYKGVEEAWKYASLIRPQSNIPFHDLGDLYHNFLKEYPQSEQSFLKAIKNDKTYIISYRALFDLYKYSYKQDTDNAKNILLTGIKNNPNNVNLKVILAEYYRNKGDKGKALIYYNEALELVKGQNNLQISEQLEKEISNLEK